MTIYKHVSDNSKKCLSVVNFGLLSVVVVVVVCSAFLAYISICRGLEKLLKITFIIWNHPNVAGFLIFNTVFFAGRQHCPMSENENNKNERHFCLISCIFTKLSQNVCLINTHILIHRYVRCDCKLWSALWFYCVFWVFSHIIDCYSCRNRFIFTKLLQTVY